MLTMGRKKLASLCLPAADGFIATLLDMSLIGNRIAGARIQAGFRTQDAFAKALKVSRGLVGQWESHKKQPGRENLRKIAKYCAVSMEYLLGNEPQMRRAVTLTLDDEIELVLMYRAMAKLSKENLLYIASVLVDPHGVGRKKREKV